ncbi:putative carboxylesterase 18 [Iris pallida]|uniref:Carboxylesterase 18 n=1 Tax=Iris pallida TaxID=29817 RepID=A0AAX6ESC9_IRIPA|nr:putative carboxylesterase 18 [Iris pallida]
MASSSSSSVVPAKAPSMSWTARIAMAILTAATDLACRRNGTVNRRLLSVLDDSVPANPTPSRGVRTVDFTVDASRGLWFRLFIPSTPPADSSPLPMVVFFHGGGFAFLSAASRAYDAVCRRFARKLPAVVASVNYRLAPEHKCPAPYADGLDVLRFLDENGGGSPDIALADLSSTFLVGDSAGGNIVHHVARRWAGAGGWKSLKLAGLVVIQPYFGGEERTESELRLTKAPLVSVPRTDWLWRAFLPEGADRDHEACNVFGPNDTKELEEGYPPAMVVVGGWDPLKDWQRRYAEGLRRRGKEVRLVEYGEAPHAFYVFPDSKEGGIFLEEMKDFIHSHAHGSNH